MQSQNNSSNKIAYLGALTLLFSYAELFIPKVIPFFKPGISNIVILLSFDLYFSQFILLNLIKVIFNAMLSGILFTPFVLVSFSQSFISSLTMYFLFRLLNGRKILSIYGISVIGSAVSAVVQIFVSSIYIGKGTQSLLGPMLIFSIFSGLFTAFLSVKLKIPQNAPELIYQTNDIQNKNKKSSYFITCIFVSCILLSVMVIILTKSVFFVVISFIAALLFQKLCHRKILFLPHISIWLFIIISSLFIPNGKILFKIGNFGITQVALSEGIEKALKLSAISAISQSATIINSKFYSNGLFYKISAYFGGLCNIFRNKKGNLITKITETLSATKIQEIQEIKKSVSIKIPFIFTSVFIMIFILSLKF